MADTLAEAAKSSPIALSGVNFFFHLTNSHLQSAPATSVHLHGPHTSGEVTDEARMLLQSTPVVDGSSDEDESTNTRNHSANTGAGASSSDTPANTPAKICHLPCNEMDGTDRPSSASAQSAPTYPNFFSRTTPTETSPPHDTAAITPTVWYMGNGMHSLTITNAAPDALTNLFASQPRKKASRKTRPNEFDTDTNIALCTAAFRGDAAEVKHILILCPTIHVSQQVLYNACRAGQFAVAYLLIRHGRVKADQRALLLACGGPCAKCVALMAENQRPTNACLLAALERQADSVMRFLLYHPRLRARKRTIFECTVNMLARSRLTPYLHAGGQLSPRRHGGTA